MIIEVQGLTKKYPSFTLEDVSFGVDAGRIVGFVGRNGAGKSTTIKGMLDLIHPDGGSVSFFGQPLRGHETAIKKRIGYSTGTLSWYPRKRVRDLVDIVRRFYDTWDDKLFRRYLDIFALDESKAPHQLSEGMKVKLNLALALSHGAEALILDEPTSGLDPFSRNELLDIFAALKRDGVAVFFSTHIISDVEKCADDIVYISKGRIVAAQTKAEFIDRNGRSDERLEDTILRLEGGNYDA